MKQFYLLLSLLFISASLSAQIFVDADAMGNNDGTSWADAYTSLSDALASAADSDDVWVAAGTYTPDSSFVVSTSITVIGGFAGTETDANDADPVANPTILNGDVAGDDVEGDTQTNRGDNVRIMYVDSLINDGVIVANFIFSGGQTGITPEEEFIDDYSGAGILSYSPVGVVACAFSGCFADFGSGVATLGGATSGSFFNGIVAGGNVAASNGVIYVNGGAGVSVTNSIFDGNTADRSAVYAFAADGFSVDNCTFTNNTGLNRGSAVGFVFCYPATLTNSVIDNNPIQAVGGAVYVAHEADLPSDPGLFVIDSCSITGNASSGNFGGGILSLDGNLTIRNSEITGNSTPGRGGMIWGNNNSLTEVKHIVVENCTVSENQGTVLGAAIYTQQAYNLTIDSSEFNMNGNETESGRGAVCMLGDFDNTEILQATNISNSSFFNNLTTSQGGAIYIQNPTTASDLTVTNTSFVGNIGPSLGGAIFLRPGVNAVFDNCEMLLNQGDDGGFIYALEEQPAFDTLNTQPASLMITNSVLGQNFASTQGGAIDAAGGNDLTVYNSIFYNNLITGEEGASGGAIIANGDTTQQNVTIINNTFGGNAALAFGDDVALFIGDGVPAEFNTEATFQNNAFLSNDNGLGNVAVETVEGSGVPNITTLGGNFFTQEPVDFTIDAADILDEDIDVLTLLTNYDPDDPEEGTDFTINCDLEGNPLVDGGTTGDLVPATDIVGADRDATPDIGAYEAACSEPSTVVDIVVESPVHNTLETLLGQAGLIATLQGPGPFTVFAPTDEAFAALSMETLDLLNEGDNLTNTLLTHVIGDLVLAAAVTDGLTAPSLAPGTNLSFTNDGAGTITVTTPQSPVATVTVADLTADNGVVHVIDVVLIPAIVNVTDIDGSGLDVQFFPNPVQDRMNVRINDLSINTMEISLINMAGQRLNNRTLTNGNNIIDFTQLPAGTYTIEINIDGTTYSKQVIRQ